MGRLENKVAVVTGSAEGIGEATVKLFAREGAKTVIADLNRAKGEQVAKAIKEAGGEAVFIQHNPRGVFQGFFAEYIPLFYGQFKESFI